LHLEQLEPKLLLANLPPTAFDHAGPYGAVSLNGKQGDAQTSLIYDANTGRVDVDVALDIELTSISIVSDSGIFTGDPAENLGGSFDLDSDTAIFKATFGASFGSLSFGNVAQPYLDVTLLINDLTVDGTLVGTGSRLSDVDLVYLPPTLIPNGQEGDSQTSIIYDPSTGAVALDVPSEFELTSIALESAAGIFTGTGAQNLDGQFDRHVPELLFKATFDASFGSLRFGTVAQPGLSEPFLLEDLTYLGSKAGGGGLGRVDLIYRRHDPTISDILDLTTAEDVPTGPIAFTIGDADASVASLVVSASSNNETLVPNANIALGGTGTQRTAVITPASDQFGSATITITVEDTRGLSADTSFTLTVEPVNDPPRITSPSELRVAENTVALPWVTSDDADGDAPRFALSGGTDRAALELDPVTGALHFRTPQDFENPADGNKDNVYEAEITVDDGHGAAATQSIRVLVTNVVETPLTARIDPVVPNPRRSAVDQIVIVFDRPVAGFDLSDLVLTHSRDETISPFPGAATLSSVDNVRWTLRNLNAMTMASGIYRLTVQASGTGITDLVGTPLATRVTLSWINGAGDSDQNNSFDQLDLVRVLQGGKYLTGQQATWSQGDWNGDGLFNQFDIIVAQQTQPSHYLQGPFAAK
jgi:hypothetical protein